MADTPPPFDASVATSYSGASDTPPPFDPSAAQSYSPDADDNHRSAVTRLTDAFQDHALQGFGGDIAHAWETHFGGYTPDQVNTAMQVMHNDYIAKTKADPNTSWADTIANGIGALGGDVANPISLVGGGSTVLGKAGIQAAAQGLGNVAQQGVEGLQGRRSTFDPLEAGESAAAGGLFDLGMQGAGAAFSKMGKAVHGYFKGTPDEAIPGAGIDAAPVDGADPVAIDHQNATKLNDLITKGYNADYILSQVKTDPDQLAAVLHARDTGQPWQVTETHAPGVVDPAQANPAEAPAFDAGAQNAGVTSQPDVVAAADAHPWAQEAAAFQGTPDTAPEIPPDFDPKNAKPVTPEDLWPTDESRAADAQAQTDKLQAEADAFKAKQAAPDADPFAAPETPTEPEAPAAQPVTQERADALNHAQTVADHIDNVSKDWSNRPETLVHAHTSDIEDPTLRKAVEGDENIKGIYADGKVHIVAERLKKASDAEAVMYHESLGHHGLASKFTDQLDKHLVDWYNGNHGSFRSDVDSWLKENPDAYEGQNKIARAAEEVLAEGSEGGKLAPSLKQKIVQTIRQFGRRMGIVKDFNDDDIDSILHMSHAAVTDGAESTGANAVKFSRRATSRLDQSGEDDALTYADGKVNEFTRHSTADLRRALDEGNSDAGRSDWKSTIKDERKNGRRVGESDREFWAAKKANKTPEEWEAEQTQGFRFSKRARPRADPSDPSLDKERGINRPKYFDNGVNRNRVDTYHDLTELTAHFASEAAPKTVRDLETVKTEAASLGLTANKIINNSKSRFGLKDLGDLDTRVQAVRKVHTETMDSAARFLDKFDEHGYNEADHANMMAKLVQAAAIDARLREDRESIARALGAFRIINSSAKKTGAEISALLQKMKESGGGLGAMADKDTFMKFMAQVKQAKEDGNVEEVSNVTQALTKPYWWEKLLTGHNAAMLSGMSTHAKNAVDNVGLMSRDFVDHVAAAMVPGSNVSKEEIAGRVIAFGKGLTDLQAYKKAIMDVVHAGDHQDAGAGKFDESHGSHAYVPVASHVLTILESADHLFKNLHVGMNLRALATRQAIAEGLKGSAAMQRAAFLAENADPKMMKQALESAKVNLLQDASSGMTQFAERAKSITPGMSPTRQMVSFGANLIFPFVRVADRTIFRQIERSPFGLIPALNRPLKEALESGDKAARDAAIAKAAVGTALIGYYWTQAAMGKITGANNNYAKAQADGADGYQPSSVERSDRYTDATAVGTNINPLSLSNATAANVATAYEAYMKGKDAKSTLKALGAAAAGTMYDNSILKDVTPVGAAAQAAGSGDPRGVGAAFVASQASSWVPNLVKQTNQTFFDPVKRDLTGDKGIGDRVKGAVVGALPFGASKAFPAKYDTFGQVQDQGKSALGLSNYNMKSDDPTIKEMARIERASKNVLITPVNAAPWKLPGGEVVLTDVQRSEYQKRAGQNFKAKADQLVADPNWRTAPMSAKAAAIKDANKDAKHDAKESMKADGTITPDQIKPIEDQYAGKL